MSKMELKEFEKTDWYGYAGAERFADGSEPMRADYEKDDEYISLIVDRTGIEIYLGYDADKSTDRPRPVGRRSGLVDYAAMIELGDVGKSRIVAFATGLVDALNELLDRIDRVFDLKAILEGDEWNLEFDEV